MLVFQQTFVNRSPQASLRCKDDTMIGALERDTMSCHSIQAETLLTCTSRTVYSRTPTRVIDHTLVMQEGRF
jgi:hypothetical protein